MADALSIEEANKIRVAMGMAPLPVPGGGAPSGPVFKQADDSDDSSDEEEPASTLERRAAAGYDNWKRLQDEEAAKKKREQQKAEIKRAREIAQRNVKLQGKGLADDDQDVSAADWLKTSKKRQREIEKARKKEQELAERDREMQAEYTSKDLAGLKVGHELGEFEGENQILTLKDADVDAESGEDELENVDLRDKERLNERLESKKRKRVYDPNDVDINGQKSLLSQYDEDIEGKKRKLFTLDGEGRTVEEATMGLEQITSKPKGLIFSLDDIMGDSKPVSDYIDASEIKVKKPKKKSKKSSRKKNDDDNDIFPINGAAGINGDMDVDAPATEAPIPKRSQADETFMDDGDLQAQIALQRRLTLKKRKKMRPEDLAKQLRAEEANAMDVVDTVEEGGLILDETSGFIENIKRPAIPEERVTPQTKTPKSAHAASPDADEEGDLTMRQSYGALEDAEESKARAERATSHEVTATGLEEEGDLNQGVGGALALLRQRNIIKTNTDDDSNARFIDRQRFLANKTKAADDANRKALLQRERDRASGRLEHMSTREREEYARATNNQREQQEARKLADVFNTEYKPNVELKYTDEFGRRMNQKEAFKQLSHQFHGKGSGKQKTEKRLKKIEDEKKHEAASVLDSSQSVGLGATSKHRKQAGVRLQ